MGAPSPTRYDARRDRRRITWLLLALGVVIIAITEVSKPGNWAWLTELGSRNGTSAKESRNRVPIAEPDEPLAPGEFRLVGNDFPGESAEANDASKNSDGTGLIISPALLRTIQDQSAGIRSGEREAYFAILAKARDTSPALLEKAGNTDVGYAELLNDPERHRGQLVTLFGEIRRFHSLPAGANELGFETLYDGWMFTDDAGKKSPYRIILAEKPDRFPEGDQVRERARFTGYFFKRYSYDTAHGLHAAPLLLGRRIHWSEARPRTDDSRSAATYLVGALSLLVMGFAGSWWWLAKNDRRQRALQKPILEPTPEALAGLQNVAARNDSNFLKDLAEQDEDFPRIAPE